MALFDDASLVTTPNGYKAGTLYSIKPTSGAGDMTVVRATTATRVNSAGLIESVANNVPRLDYTDSTCPSLLVEPQRTNLVLYSEQFDNAAWTTNASPTITANTTTAPNGTLTADTIAAGGANSGVYQVPTVSVAVAYAFSVYVKNISSSTAITIGCDLNPINATLIFNAVSGTITSVGAGITASAVTNEGNGWFRVFGTYVTTNTPNTFIVFGGGVMSFAVWGAQLELGSYPTSYIPTTSAAVTRNADAISKTGISSLIGQTEGVLFLDLFASAKNDDTNTYGTWLVAGTATENFQIYNLGTTLYWYARNTGGIIIDQTADQTIVEGTRYKIAFAYKSGDYALYINGVQKRTNANVNVPVGVSQFNLSGGGYGAVPAVVKNEYNSAILFPTRLTNAELAQLTTI
jgi:hypothetical protein